MTKTPLINPLFNRTYVSKIERLGISFDTSMREGDVLKGFILRPEVYRPLFRCGQTCLIKEGELLIPYKKGHFQAWSEIREHEEGGQAVWTKEGFRSFGSAYSQISLDQFNHEGRFPLGEEGVYLDILTRAFGEHPHNSIRLHKVRNETVVSHSFGFYPKNRADSIYAFGKLAVGRHPSMVASPDPIDYVLEKPDHFSLTRIELTADKYVKILSIIREGNFTPYNLLTSNCKHFVQAIVCEVLRKSCNKSVLLPGQLGSWLAQELPESTTVDKSQMHL